MSAMSVYNITGALSFLDNIPQQRDNDAPSLKIIKD